jgi:hypothetical protein
MNASCSASQPSSNSGYRRHWIPPAPKSVRVWPVAGPSRELHELVPPEQPLPKRSGIAAIPLWALQLAAILALVTLAVVLRYLSN